MTNDVKPPLKVKRLSIFMAGAYQLQLLHFSEPGDAPRTWYVTKGPELVGAMRDVDVGDLEKLEQRCVELEATRNRMQEQLDRFDELERELAQAQTDPANSDAEPQEELGLGATIAAAAITALAGAALSKPTTRRLQKATVPAQEVVHAAL